MRRNFYIILSVAVLSLYLLIPTFGQFKEKTEDLAAQELPAPWYYKFFPSKQVNLGLDLKGGIYLELEVRIQEALENRLDLLASEITRQMDDKKIAIKTSREDKPLRLVIETTSPTDLSAVQALVKEYYRGDLVEAELSKTELSGTELSATGMSATNLKLQMTDSFQENIRELTLQQAVETIRNRIDRYGVSEPSIHRLGGDKVSVELPGIKNPDRAIEMIKKAGRLEFKLVDKSVPAAQLQLWVAQARKDHNLKDDFSIDTVDRLNALLEKFLPKGDEVAFQLAVDPVSKKTVGGSPFLLKKKVEISGDMLSNAQVNVDPNRNKPYVSLSLNNTGARLFQKVTGDNVNEQLAILLDGNVMSAPVIQTEIAGGEAQITMGSGSYADILKEAQDLTLVLREGALPARLQELTKTVIGPSLGAASIKQGIRVTLIGGLIVIFFMLAYYKKAGLFANISLALNMILILALLTLFGGTLTLPGIAALVLTIGMAVDANVIIFERIRDELRDGQDQKVAVELGYKNAMSAVVDSNLTTLLAGIVLYQFGTGPIRGFAVTLMIGILTTMFTAIYVTRAFQDWSLARSLRKTGVSR